MNFLMWLAHLTFWQWVGICYLIGVVAFAFATSDQIRENPDNDPDVALAADLTRYSRPRRVLLAVITCFWALLWPLFVLQSAAGKLAKVLRRAANGLRAYADRLGEEQ